SGPAEDTRDTIQFVRKIKRINPDAEIIVQHYIPTPHPDAMYGNVDDQIELPRTPDEWATERWLNFTIRHDPHLPCLPRRLKRGIDNFARVINSRWPTIQDSRLPACRRLLLKTLSGWRYSLGFYDSPLELAWAQKFVALRKPGWERVCRSAARQHIGC